MSLSHSPQIVTDGLVFCVDAAGKRSYPGTGTVWTDLVGENDGTLTNGPTFSAVNGGSLVFDGTDDYVTTSFGNGDAATDPKTYSIWVKPSIDIDVSTAEDVFFAQSFIDGISWRYIGGKFFYTDEIVSGIYTTFTRLPGTFTPGVWYHFALALDGSYGNWYTNGSYIRQDAYSAFTFTQNLVIGAQVAGGVNTKPLHGGIAMFSVYDRALSATEVLQNYNATRGRFV